MIINALQQFQAYKICLISKSAIPDWFLRNGINTKGLQKKKQSPVLDHIPLRSHSFLGLPFFLALMYPTMSHQLSCPSSLLAEELLIVRNCGLLICVLGSQHSVRKGAYAQQMFIKRRSQCHTQHFHTSDLRSQISHRPNSVRIVRATSSERASYSSNNSQVMERKQNLWHGWRQSLTFQLSESFIQSRDHP